MTQKYLRHVPFRVLATPAEIGHIAALRQSCFLPYLLVMGDQDDDA